MNYNPDFGHVYLLKTEGHNYYKVGYTALDIIPRLNNIRIACPFRLYPAGAYYVKSPRKVESYLHDKLKQYRMYGEWFDLPEEAIDEVSASLTRIAIDCECSKFCRGEYKPYKNGAFNSKLNNWYQEFRARHKLIKVTVDVDEDTARKYEALPNKTEAIHQMLQASKAEATK